MSRDRIPQVDAVRGIAAAAVAFVFHVHFLLGDYRTGPLDGLPVFTWLHAYGWTMVDLFFVVSGYIFAHVYASGEVFTAGARQFWVARFARLYPLHLLTLVIVAIVLALGTPVTGGSIRTDGWHFALNLLMLQESGLNDRFSFNIPTWSISVEMLCYAIFFLVAGLHFKWLVTWSAMLALGGLALTISGDPSVVHIARGICGFFAGIIVYRHRNAPVVVPLALLAAGAILFLLPKVFDKGSVLALTCWAGVLMLAPKVALLGWRPFTWLGDLSYSIYLIHAPVFWSLNIFVFGGERVPDEMQPVALAGAVALILLLSDLSYRFFETPARRAINAFGKTQPPRAALAT
ncbi:acyltransferase [Erythrobacter sp. SDW2]|uniref:acyltransferase family protein n=1 Tax=Erythrobacter sp. SDW2 TaxID=2907154 RepID=UPI001F490D52|nr:acyltransferase [Erythrobacter sp. SDW2]UIP07959.1 acyltransferase [Erythrobacter sp. SDW2]